MQSEINKETRFSSFSAVAGFVLLLLIPVSAIWILGSAVLDQFASNQLNAATHQLEEKAEAISDQLDLENFFNSLFRRYYDELYSGGKIDSERVEQLATACSAGQLGFISAVFVDGMLVTPSEQLGEYESTLVNTWEIMHEYTAKPRFDQVKKLNTLFGATFGIGLLLSHEGRIMRFSGHQGTGFIFYARRPDKSKLDGVIIVLWSLPDINKIAGFLPSHLTEGINLSIQSQISEKSAKVMPSGHRVLTVRKKIGNRFLVIEDDFTGLNPEYLKTLLKIFLLFMILTMGMLVKDYGLLSRMGTASIRLKLIGLVLYVVALPLSGLIYFGWKYVAERRELLVQEAYIACHNSLNDLEIGFEKEKAELLARFRGYKNRPEMKTDPSVLLPMFRDLDEQQLTNLVEVRDLNANTLLTTQRKETAKQIGVIGKAVARLGINNFLGHRLGPGKSLTLSASEVVLQEFLESPFGGWARIFESPDELHQVAFGGFDIFWYWDVFNDQDDRAAFIVLDQHVRWEVRRYLLKSLARRSSYGQGALRLFAWSGVYSRLWPEETENSAALMPFLGQVMRAGSPQSAIVRWNNADWIAAGAPGKRLSDSFLISLYPLDEIEREISVISSNLAWGVIFTLILALLVGTLFSHTILRPLANLILGVQALRRQDTSFRLEIMQNDELGQLSATFNATTETLADILSAKAVQAQLIPEKAPEIEGYAADLIYIPAADLGGDYCDIIPIGSSRWLLVIGDVTGHGVSSALVTAMTKAIVSEYAMNSELSLQEMFVCLNELLFTQFKRKKCMTFFAALLDSVSGRLDCFNAGHPMPLHFSGGSRQPFPVLGRPPLGFSMRNQEFPQATLQIANGDCLIFYTDIFIESADENGQPYGTAGLARICEKYLHLPPDEMRAEILNAVRGCSDKELDDDLTLIILKRNIST
ncbi:MAG: SpoIIE family protein phosphatase [Candidatus Riflebacteria bacterium]|nr:SpoIIE family protein phosphatase [Candidatus Riflebacteria bacterium]